MLEYLKEYKDQNYDAFFFLPGEKKEEMKIQVSKYANPGEKVEGSIMGDWWHIILFREDEEGFVQDDDQREAILADPLEYMSMLIPLNFYGIICRKTTKSHVMVDDIVANFFTE